MAGHSKWKQIKRKKAVTDARRGAHFTKLIKEITVAAKQGGGDPAGNARLRVAIEAARNANMPADNIDRAVKKGTGELEGVHYEEVTYEGIGPGGTLYCIDVVTDNRNRTVPELRKIFEKHNGGLGSSGSSTWAFDQKGVITLDKAAATEEQLFDIAVGAGAEDVQDDGEEWWIATPVTQLDAVRDALEAAKIALKSGKMDRVPKQPKVLSGREAEVCMNLLDALDAQDDVQKVSTDFEPSAEAIAALEG